MDTGLLLPLVIGLASLLLGLLTIFFSLRSSSNNELGRRLTNFVDRPAAEPRNSDVENVVRRDELAGSFGSRTLVPAFKRLGRLFGRLTPQKTLETLARQIDIAGRPLGLGPREFYGLRLVFTLLGFWLAFTLLRGGLTTQKLLFAALAVALSSYLPKFWLSRRVGGRQDKIRRGLPDALDMLSVCAEAGLGFDQSLQRVSEHWNTPTAVELGRVVQEMEMGVQRQQALRNLSNRLDIMELSSFVAVIVQSDQLGMSIAETLHTQAKQMREERRFRAQEQARKIPLKMLFPMLLLILPAMFAVILGPAIPALRQVFEVATRNFGP
jgi:tight adherence protein C